jgi:CheY-like chemotaxis protein
MQEQPNRGYEALIMVVDDNPDFLSGVELTLQMEGYRVLTAADGQQALDQLQAAFLGKGEEGASLNRLPDLILADIMMPVMDGYEFYDRVRSSPYTNHIPFIFLTAKSSDEDIRRGKELGSDDYLAKPFPPEDLLASVKGKLKRASQRRTMMDRLTEDFNGPRSGMIIVVAVVGLLIISAFCLGLLLPQLWQ